MGKADAGLRAKFQKNLKRRQFTPIESYVSWGVPDCHVLFHGGIDVWIEFKRKGKPLRPGQKGWLQRRSSLGGRCFIVEGDQFATAIYEGRDIEMEVPIYAGPYDWPTIQKILSGP